MMPRMRGSVFTTWTIRVINGVSQALSASLARSLALSVSLCTPLVLPSGILYYNTRKGRTTGSADVPRPLHICLQGHIGNNRSPCARALAPQLHLQVPGSYAYTQTHTRIHRYMQRQVGPRPAAIRVAPLKNFLLLRLPALHHHTHPLLDRSQDSTSSSWRQSSSAQRHTQGNLPCPVRRRALSPRRAHAPSLRAL